MFVKRRNCKFFFQSDISILHPLSLLRDSLVWVLSLTVMCFQDQNQKKNQLIHVSTSDHSPGHGYNY